MNKVISCLLLLISATVFAETRSVVPRADGEGSLGTGAKAWGTNYSKEVHTRKIVHDGVEQPVIPVPVFEDGVVRTLQTSGTNTLLWQALSGPSAPLGVAGTNYYFFTNYAAGLVQNYQVEPGVTVLQFFVQGAGGGSTYGGAGELREVVMPTVPGMQYAIGVGMPGTNNLVTSAHPTHGGWPNGGNTSTNAGDVRYCASGGGFSFVAKWLGPDWAAYSNVEDFVVIAGGGPGAYGGAVYAPPSGSFYPLGNNANSNGYLTTGAWADDVYGKNYHFGTNAYTSLNLATNFLVPSHAYNLGVATNLAQACGGGGGWICGPGGIVGVSNASMAISSGAPGLGWANTSYVWSCQATRSSSNAVAGLGDPYYVPGRGFRQQPGYVTVKR
jgi:hypothetical protein